MGKKKHLTNILTNTFIKFGLVPVSIVSFIFIVSYYYSNLFLIQYNTNFIIHHVLDESNEIIENHILLIEEKLLSISRDALLIQSQQESLFRDKNIYLPTNLEFDFAPNGVYYQTTHTKSSLYYSSTTKIGEKEKKKALLTYKMENIFQNIVDNNQMIIASYFNSWDNMNRYYPYIDNVYKQFGSSIDVKKHPFYYLADKKHNPSKNYVWTDTYNDPAGKGWMLSCIVPIYNGEFLEGVSGIDITINNIIKHMIKKKLPFEADMLIINKDNMVLASSSNIKDFFQEQYQDILKSNKNILNIKIRDRDYIIVKKTVPSTKWKIIIFIKKCHLLHDINHIQKKINNTILLSMIVLLIFILIYSYIIFKIFKKDMNNIIIPINQLTQQTILVNDGYTFISIKKSGIYEIDKLRDNFENMIHSVCKHKEELEEINKTLEQRIKEQVNEALIKDKQIQKYSKHAQMGEMIGMIAHQWRQPLTAISATSSNILLRSTLGTLDDETIKSTTSRIVEQCQQMSDTINTFMNFVKPSSEKKEFTLYHSINNIIEIMGIQLVTHNISIYRDDVDERVTLVGYEDLIEQVLINILANARDAFDELNINNKFIRISVKSQNNIPVITIEDNAGGIDNRVKDRIFNPYFTTKKEGKGTGLGLYMSLDIMRKSFDGDITHTNINNGSKFTIYCGR